MAYFFGESFDLYGNITDAVLGGYWDASSVSVGNSVLLSPGRFLNSKAIWWSSSTRFDKTSGVNDSVHHFNIAYNQQVSIGTTPTQSSAIQLVDGATIQCSIVFRIDGSIIITSGGTGGTILATFNNAFGLAFTWLSFEFEVVIHNTTGSFTVRRNGNTVNDFQATGLDTAVSANNYANKIFLSGPGSTHYVDDFLWRSDASSVAWAGDIRCYARMPISDVSTQFTRSLAGSVVPVIPFIQASTTATSTSAAFYIPFYATCSGTIGTIVVSLATGYTGNLKSSLYSTNIGTSTPAAILGSATIVVNPAAGNVTLTFGTPVAVTQGNYYWLALMSDSGSGSWNIAYSGSSPGYNVSGVSQNTTYANFPIANPITNPNSRCPVLTVSITPTTMSNAAFVGELVQDGTSTYVTSSTNGQADLYNVAPQPGVVSVIGVTTIGLALKNDTGTRNAAIQLKSGSTTVQTASTPLLIGTWNWIYRNDVVDPATGVAWTPSGVDSAQIGPVVTA